VHDLGPEAGLVDDPALRRSGGWRVRRPMLARHPGTRGGLGPASMQRIPR
jgi:hypothetical protein